MELIRNRDKIVKVIRMFFPQAKIYLFGSYARGDYTKASDVDIAIDIGKKMPMTEHGQIISMINVLNLLQEVDVVDFHRIPEAMQKNILHLFFTLFNFFN